MNGLIPINYDDFYKFVTSLGLLTVAFGLYGFARYANLTFIIGLFIGTFMAWWAGSKWYNKQKVRDRIEELQLEKELFELERPKPQKSSA